jgi:CheY-like chemotaxis protein
VLPKPEPKAGIAHILVVEDEVLVRALIAQELRAAGCAVIEASRADDALVYLKAGARVDMVFSDIHVPGTLDGLQLAERIKRDFPAIPVIITSGNAPPPAVSAFGLFVAKPYDVTHTVTLILTNLGLAPPRGPR